MNNILKKIIEKKKEKVKIYKKDLYTENALLKNIKNVKNFSDFKNKIKKRDAQKKNFYNY